MDEVATRPQTRTSMRAKLVLLAIWPDGRGRVFSLPERGRVTIGRSNKCEVQIGDDSISRTHAALTLDAEMTLEDLGSRNGTRLRGTRLSPNESSTLCPGDTFELGDLLLTLQERSERPRRSQAGSSAEGTVIERVARGNISVLILGETGVGKEVLTRQIHMASPRAAKPFLRLNCAALSESLIESELFGYEKGAFTGAAGTKLGLLETAQGGTILLDEVGELPPTIQSKLLRVIEQRELFRVGAVTSRKIDVRFVAATNRDLEAEMERGTFRRDLFFRLAGAILRVPPLRERRAEIAGFAREFLAEAVDPGDPVPELAPNAASWLEKQQWPGNLRELRNTMERALLLSGGATIKVEHVKSTLGVQAPLEAPAAMDERERIVDALNRCAGNQSEAARRLGMARNTLIARIKKYGLSRPRAGRD